jgi:hypothetical protein
MYRPIRLTNVVLAAITSALSQEVKALEARDQAREARLTRLENSR